MIAYEMNSVLLISFSNTSDPVELVSWASVIAVGELRGREGKRAGQLGELQRGRRGKNLPDE